MAVTQPRSCNGSRVVRLNTRPLHNHKSAGPSRAYASCLTSLRSSLSGSSLQAPSCERVLTFDCSCKIDLVAIVRSCWRLPHPSIDRTRSSARTRCHACAVSVILARESTLLPEPGVSGGVPSICGEPSTRKFSLRQQSFAVGVYTCVAAGGVSAPYVSHLYLPSWRMIEKPEKEFAYMERPAGKLAALEVSGPRPLQSRAVLLFLEKRDASRSSSGPTLHEARTPMGASAGSSRICFTGRPFRAPHQKPMRLTANLPTLSKY